MESTSVPLSPPARTVGLERLPVRIQEIADHLNAGGEAEPGMTEEWQRLAPTRSRAIDSINQIGGRGFMFQRLTDPVCPHCCPSRAMRSDINGRALAALNDGKPYRHSRQMYFLASLCDDSTVSYRVGPDSTVQIVFFLCADCGTITVKHSL